MAIAKKTPPKKEKKEAEKAEKKAPQMTPNKMCRDLLLERKYTDSQIVEKVSAVFPDSKFVKAYVSTTRIDLNKGYYKGVDEDLQENPISRLVDYEDKGVITIDAAKAFKAEKDEAERKLKAEEKATKKATGGVRTNKRIGGGQTDDGSVKNAPKKGSRKKPNPKQK